MIWFLRTVFTIVLLSMLAVTTWAGNHTALWAIPRDVYSHPWFVATLFDTYFAFLTFYVWVFYKEAGVAGKILWLAAILLLGNIAMAAYLLWKLFQLPANAPLEELLLRKSAR